jgi:peptidyl-prolyl cis-trans isomerase B (cyclophilin B)
MRRMLLRRTALPLAVIGLLALTGCGDEDPDETTAPAAEGVSCDYPTSGQEATKDVEPPPATATATGTVPVTVTTSVGELALALDADAAPCTVNSFLSLAEQGYFDGTTCHRLTTAADNGIAVLQCGDPSASGSGGPGYRFDDELTGQETYPAGTLAMANAGADTNGSQFFFVYGDTPLDPDFTVFGTFDEAGVELIRGVAEQGSDQSYPDGSGRPNQAVDIESVTVDEPAS